jgi:hypothetical protein
LFSYTFGSVDSKELGCTKIGQFALLIASVAGKGLRPNWRVCVAEKAKTPASILALPDQIRILPKDNNTLPIPFCQERNL